MELEGGALRERTTNKSEVPQFINFHRQLSHGPIDDSASQNSSEPAPSYKGSSAIPLSETSSVDIKKAAPSAWGSLKLWTFELLAILAIFASLAAITAFLQLYQERPVSDWSFKVSINTVIAVFVGLLKVAILLVVAEGISQLKWMFYLQPQSLYTIGIFEAGSRSPFSAVKLLGQVCTKQILAPAGALIVIGSLFIEPFTQQIIEYSPCIQASLASTGIVPRTNNFTLFEKSHDGRDTLQLPLPMQGLIYGGLLGLNLSSYLPVSCSTGNCDVADFWTIGYSSTCWNTTNQLRCSDEVERNGTVFRCTWPTAGLSISTVNQTDGNAYTSPVLTVSASAGSNETLLPWGTTVKMLMTNANAGLHAVECYLSPSLQKFSAQVASGELIETQQSSHNIPDFSSSSNSCRILLSCLPPASLSRLGQIHYLFNDSSEWTWLNSSDTTCDNLPDYVPLACAYSYAYFSEESIGSFFVDTFNANATEDQGLVAATGDILSQAFYNNGENSFQRTAEIMQNMTKAMTIYMRGAGDPSNSAPAPGKILETKTCIRVRWKWFILPTVLGLLTIFFLLAVIVKALRNGENPNWKSSPLPYLFGLQQRFAHIDDLDEMKKQAQMTKVQLVWTEKGWGLAEVGG